MKVIIAGGRDITMTPSQKRYILQKIGDNTITTLICGMARGIDIQAYDLLKKRVPIEEYPALWDDLTDFPVKIQERNNKKYNCLAGINRNERMARIADGIIIFEGNSGTDNMYSLARDYNLKIIKDFR